MKSKKLVFTEVRQDGNYISYQAESPFGTYYIDQTTDKIRLAPIATIAEIRR